MIVLAFALATLLSATPAEPAAPPRRVVVQVAETDGVAAAELAALVERHGLAEPPPMQVAPDDGTRARLTTARAQCEAAPTVAVFWLDARRNDEWRVYALPCDTGAPLVREIVVTRGEEEASIEAAWVIMRSSSVAIAEGHEVAMQGADPAAIDPPTAPPPAPAKPSPVAPPPPRDAPKRPLRWQLTAGYGGEAMSTRPRWRNGVLARLSFAPRPRLRLALGYALLLPATRNEPAGFTWWQHQIGLWIAAVLPVHPQLALELRAGPELELVRWRSQADARGRVRAVPRFGADVGLQPVLARGRRTVLALDVGVGLAIALVDVDFVTCAATAAACAGADRRVVLDAWRVRPRARAGLSVQF